MPTLQKITANNIEIAYYETGAGPLVLCLHGFPDSPHTWSKLAPAIAAMGYRVVTPFLRGYGASEIPESGRFGVTELAGDALGLISALGYDDAIVIGHDWGGMAAYVAANTDPDKVSRLVTLAMPHPASIKPSLRGLWRSRHFITFQFKDSARRFMSRDGFSGVDAIYKRWSPNWDFTAEDLSEAKNAMSSPGNLDAALGYYWSFREDSFLTKNDQAGTTARRQTSVPTLCIVGDCDGALDMATMPKTPSCFSGEYRYEALAGAGHFVHCERPDEVAALISAFIEPAKQPAS